MLPRHKAEAVAQGSQDAAIEEDVACVPQSLRWVGQGGIFGLGKEGAAFRCTMPHNMAFSGR
jgi:hypothetical protein